MRQVDPTRQLVGSEGLLVVTPTFNERDNLEPFVADVLEVAPRAHVLVVDDASPDGTGDVADALARKDPRVFCLHRPAKLGLGTAYADAFAWALCRNYALVATMDADRSHDPSDLPRLARAIEEGADLALGSRNVLGGGVLGWGLGRHLLSKGGSLYARAILQTGVRDMTTGYKLYRRRTLAAIEPPTIRSNGYAFQIETTYRALRRGLAVAEVPIVFCDRRVGHSKMSQRIFGEAVLEVWRLRLGVR